MLTITKTAQNVINLANESGGSVTFTIRQLQDDNTFLTIQDSTVLANGYQSDYTFASDGVYQVVEVSGPTTNVIVYAAIETAILGLIVTIHSEDCCCNSKTQMLRLYYYNAIMANFYLFMAMINTTYVDNWIYTAANTDELQNLYCLSDVITKITELVDAGNLITESCDDC